MKKIFAIPLEKGILCSHFGHCDQFAIVDVEEDSISNEKWITPPPHEPGLLPAWLAEKGVTNVIAGGMGQRAIELFYKEKIEVRVGAPQEKPRKLVNDYLKNTLVTISNSCDH